jgi:hypothetical protein
MSRAELIWFLIGQKYEVTRMLLSLIPPFDRVTTDQLRLQDIFSQVGCTNHRQILELYDRMDSLFEEIFARAQTYND